MKTLYYLFVFLIFASLSACNKEKLTKPTQSGANTFSCKINGKVYVAKDDLFAPGLVGGLSGPGNNNFYQFIGEAIVYRGDKSSYTLDLAVSPLTVEGTYNFTSARINANTGSYGRYKSNSGSINFTHIDYASRITSGTFSFIAVNSENPSDVVTITDGRFDMKN